MGRGLPGWQAGQARRMPHAACARWRQCQQPSSAPASTCKAYRYSRLGSLVTGPLLQVSHILLLLLLLCCRACADPQARAWCQGWAASQPGPFHQQNVLERRLSHPGAAEPQVMRLWTQKLPGLCCSRRCSCGVWGGWCGVWGLMRVQAMRCCSCGQLLLRVGAIAIWAFMACAAWACVY